MDRDRPASKSEARRLAVQDGERLEANQQRYTVSREAMTTHLVEDRRAVVSPWGLGNSKIGLGVFTYSKLPGRDESCPGATDYCEEVCVGVEVKVLTADLRWVPAGQLREGDELVGFDEHHPGPKLRRRYRRAVVTSHRVRKRKAVLVNVGGRWIRTTPEHRFLVREQRGYATRFAWKRCDELVRGDELPRFLQVWGEERTRDAGYLAGIYDGEGCWTDGLVGFSQKPGPVLDNVQAMLESRGYTVWRYHPEGRSAVILRIGRRYEAMRFLGSIRPARLLANASFFGEPMQARTFERVREVRHLPLPAPVAVMETSTATFIAEGFGAHNCYAMRMRTNPHLGLLHEANTARGAELPPLPEEARLVRGHVSGDFDSVEYVEAWVRLAESRPEVLFWFYTRSYRVPELKEALEALRALPNVQVWASMDPETDAPRGPDGEYWRCAWLDGDARLTRTGVESKRAYRIRGFPEIIPACPEETGERPNCEACGYCFKAKRGDLVFLEHRKPKA